MRWRVGGVEDHHAGRQLLKRVPLGEYLEGFLLSLLDVLGVDGGRSNDVGGDKEFLILAHIRFWFMVFRMREN